MAETPLIALEAVDLSLDGRAVLRGVSLRSDARRAAVLGRNGSGKTTLARVMAGLQAPAAGRVAIAGVDVARDRRAALGTVGILFQNPDHQIIFPTVGEELSFGLRQMGLSKTDTAARVAQVLESFGKASWHDAAIHQLSQGQRQLVCLMAILAMAPRLIILDEPFSGLDIPTGLHLARVLERVAAGIVQITHDPGSVAGYGHVIWLEQGAVEAQGPAAQVVPAYRAAMAELGGRDDLTDLTG